MKENVIKKIILILILIFSINSYSQIVIENNVFYSRYQKAKSYLEHVENIEVTINSDNIFIVVNNIKEQLIIIEKVKNNGLDLFKCRRKKDNKLVYVSKDMNKKLLSVVYDMKTEEEFMIFIPIKNENQTIYRRF